MSKTILYTLAAEKLFKKYDSRDGHPDNVTTHYLGEEVELNLTIDEAEDFEREVRAKLDEDVLTKEVFGSLLRYLGDEELLPDFALRVEPTGETVLWSAFSKRPNEGFYPEGYLDGVRALLLMGNEVALPLGRSHRFTLRAVGSEPVAVQGFEREETGGGCSALIHHVSPQLEILITAKDDDQAPTTMGQAVTVGLYSRAPSECLVFVNAPSLRKFLAGDVTPSRAVEKPAPAIVEKSNPRFVWCVGAIQDAFPDIPDSALPDDGTTVLWDRQEKRAAMTIAREYAQLMCLEVVGNGGAPFTSLEEWMNNTSAEAFESEGVTGTKEEFTK